MCWMTCLRAGKKQKGLYARSLLKEDYKTSQVKTPLYYYKLISLYSRPEFTHQSLPELVQLHSMQNIKGQIVAPWGIDSSCCFIPSCCRKCYSINNGNINGPLSLLGCDFTCDHFWHCKGENS